MFTSVYTPIIYIFKGKHIRHIRQVYTPEVFKIKYKGITYTNIKAL
jgi:hypothetical protein